MEAESPKRNKRKRGEHKPIKFRCDYPSTPLRVLQARGWRQVDDSSWDLWWCETGELRLALEGRSLRPQQRVAHFLSHCELTRKNYLYRNLKRYKRLLLRAGKSREAELCDAMPTSFELPSEYRMLVEEYRRAPGTTWIVKPASGSQGRGIFLFQRLRDLNEWRAKDHSTAAAANNSSETENSTVSQDTYLVQKYIDNPYLLEGRKFDLRIYVLVTSFQPLKVWLAREGFARLSSEQFSLERIDDSRVHLTNMSIQLRPNRKCLSSSERRDTEEEKDDAEKSLGLGRKWALNCLREYLTERHGARTVNDLFKRIAGPGIAHRIVHFDGC
ncbi:probable tubulin polyglutamylase TTLL9 isoform X2 [Nasonia vitripennis]|uniref:Tubulin--tyrosine ligase-like protein 9 n=1 Tax=Nasonia vitripennis TaxID=7425 RepID=A0A7M7PZX2_NASVI|nr:probable tubulin polyglutamylase TTLL9 isoform X2 [Nasonia vitripennis]